MGSIADGVLSAIEAETGRRFGSVTYTEAYDGTRQSTLFLRNDPLISVTSVSRQGTTLTAGSSPTYPPAQVILMSGALRLTDGSSWDAGPGSIIVTYVAGWGSTPPDGLIRAGVLWAAHLFTAGRFPASGVKVAALGKRPEIIGQMIQPFRKAWGVP